MIEMEAPIREEGKFEIGDLVHALDGIYEGDGKIVAWSDHYRNFCVHFADDEPHGGYGALHECDGITPDNRGRWYPPTCLTLLE